MTTSKEVVVMLSVNSEYSKKREDTFVYAEQRIRFLSVYAQNLFTQTNVRNEDQ